MLARVQHASTANTSQLPRPLTHPTSPASLVHTLPRHSAHLLLGLELLLLQLLHLPSKHGLGGCGGVDARGLQAAQGAGGAASATGQGGRRTLTAPSDLPWTQRSSTTQGEGRPSSSTAEHDRTLGTATQSTTGHLEQPHKSTA